jgi:hypothetical protein
MLSYRPWRGSWTMPQPWPVSRSTSSCGRTSDRMRFTRRPLLGGLADIDARAVEVFHAAHSISPTGGTTYFAECLSGRGGLGRFRLTSIEKPLVMVRSMIVPPRGNRHEGKYEEVWGGLCYYLLGRGTCQSEWGLAVSTPCRSQPANRLPHETSCSHAEPDRSTHGITHALVMNRLAASFSWASPLPRPLQVSNSEVPEN